MHRIQVGPMPITRFDRVPLAGPVLEPPRAVGHIGTVLGLAGPVLGLDRPEAALGHKALAYCSIQGRSRSDEQTVNAAGSGSGCPAAPEAACSASLPTRC